MVISTQLVKCPKCKFSFHNNVGFDTCPRCGGQIDPHQRSNIAQGSSVNNKSKKQQQEELSKVLSFGQPPGSTVAVVTPIDRELAQSKALSRKDIEDVSKVLEFTGDRS